MRASETLVWRLRGDSGRSRLGRPTVCVRELALRAVALGRAWTLLESRKNSKPRIREMLDAKRAARAKRSPQRSVHALFGGVIMLHEIP